MTKPLVTLLLLAALAGCGSSRAGGTLPSDASPVAIEPTPPPDGQRWDKLSQWSLFADAPAQIPAAGVLPYDVISVLYADDALKHRFLWVPEGGTLAYSDTDRWTLPVGAVLIKTFSFPEASGREHLVETRLLVHESAGFIPHVYVWNDEQTEATRFVAGKTVTVNWVDDTGASVTQPYNIPNTNACQSCHGDEPDTHPLGPRTRQLDRDHDYGAGPENQIDHLANLGLLDATPSAVREHLVDPFGDGPASDRARSYMDANCAHCHEDDGQAHSTNFLLTWEATDPVTGSPANWGVCKFPTSAGHAGGGLVYDVVPGDPDQSILVHRVESSDKTVKMPPLLTLKPHLAGAQVIRDWIKGLTPPGCGP